MRSIFALGVLAFAGLCATQDAPQNDYPYTINPEDVSESDRQTWCDNQKAQCPLICLQQPGVTSMTTIENDCDKDSLTYTCVCENNVSPNVTQWSQTLPYYICTEWGNKCVKDCGLGNNNCADKCRANHPCGAQNPNPPNSSIPTTMSATGSAAAQTSIPDTGFGGAQATDSADGQGAASSMLNLGQSYGLAVVFAGVFAGFALIL